MLKVAFLRYFKLTVSNICFNSDELNFKSVNHPKKKKLSEEYNLFLKDFSNKLCCVDIFSIWMILAI